MADQYEAHVPPELADLLPEFLRNRRSQLQGLRGAAKEQDFERVREFANSMIGVGRPYGFPEVSSLGKRIDNSARDRDDQYAFASGNLAEFSRHVAAVEVG